MQASVAWNQCFRFPVSEWRKYLVKGIFTVFFPLIVMIDYAVSCTFPWRVTFITLNVQLRDWQGQRHRRSHTQGCSHWEASWPTQGLEPQPWFHNHRSNLSANWPRWQPAEGTCWALRVMNGRWSRIWHLVKNNIII